MNNDEELKNFVDKLEIVYAILIAWGCREMSIKNLERDKK